MWKAYRKLVGRNDPVVAALLLALARTREPKAIETLIDLARDPSLGTPDLLALYLPGLDIVQHALFQDRAAGALSPSAAADRLAALEHYYKFLDESLAPLLAGEPPGPRLIVLVTQPGRVEHPGSGLLGLSGDSAGSGRTSAALTAVAPTVLHALGVPIARDLASPPAIQLFSPVFAAGHPVRDVATYGTHRSTARTGAGAPLDREMIERMRSLGYVR